MLAAAVSDGSDSVFVDLLTYADLESLKTKRASANAADAAAVKKNASKRYLILTYAAEYDRVHYPLPLLFEEHVDPDALQATVRRLTAENKRLSAATAGGGSSASGEKLRDENDALRATVRDLRRELDLRDGDAAPGTAADLVHGHAYEQLERLHAEVRTLNKEMKLLRRERDDLASALQGKETELLNAQSSKRRMLATKQKELDAAAAESARRRELERELRAKVKDLATECDGLQRRLRSGGAAYGYAGASRGASPARGLGRAPPRPGAASPSSRGTGAARASSVDRDRPWRAGMSLSRGSSPAPRGGHGHGGGGGFRTPTARSPSPAARLRGRSPTPRGAGASPGRFDPTAYVREKRDRDAARYMNSRAGIASGAASPARVGERSQAWMSSSNSNAGSRVGTPTAASPARPRGGRERRAAATGVTNGLRSSNDSGGNAAANVSASASASPGRILRDVKQKLSAYASKDDGWAGAAKENARPADGGGGGGGAKPPLAKAGHGDANAEIADIDSRLAALQSFLREAKSTAA